MNIKFRLRIENEDPLSIKRYDTKTIDTDNLNKEDIHLLTERFREFHKYVISSIKNIEFHKEKDIFTIQEIVLEEVEE